MEEKYCQSCGMPMGTRNASYGTERDGSTSKEYCSYCYEKGGFTADCTMAEMIDFCIPHMVSSSENMTEAKAREMMEEFFPMLKRWKEN